MNGAHDRPWLDNYPSNTILSFEIPEINLYTFLENTASKYGDHTAIIYEDTVMSFAELRDRTERLAGAWVKLGVQKGDRIGLMVSNQPDYVVAYYAALKLGMIVVQINPMYTTRELLEIFKDASMNCLVVERENIVKLSEIESEYAFEHIFASGEAKRKDENLVFHDLEELIKRANPFVETALLSAKTDVAVIQYTGGTTGKKKGAMLTHYNLVANVLQSKALYGEKMLFGKEIILTATPLYHVYGMTVGMNLGIYLGAANLLVKKFELEKVLNMIKRYRPTFFPGVPKMYNAFVNHPDIEKYGLDCFKICSSGSAPLPVEIIRQFEKLTGSTIGEGYGLSETSPSTHRNPPFGVRKVGSIGLPLPGTDCRIVDENGENLPEKSVGELLINGPQVMLGYWNKPKETKQAIKESWFYTGDLATMDDQGYFYITGRKKEMILVGGFNVYPQEVEGVLYEHPGVKEAAVVGIADSEIGEWVKAFVVPKEGKSVDIEELKTFCYRQLTRYKVPKQFEIIEELPRNSVGKLLKRLLVERGKVK